MVAAVIYPTGAQLQSPPNGFIEMFGNSPQTSLLRVTTGTFVANGATSVTVAQTAVTAASIILISLNTVGGTVGAIPAVQTLTAGTGFTVAGTASDTSTYNYMVLG
jgi:hypothetical protein